MGEYLTIPKKNKQIVEGKGPYFSYIAAGMQGWRTTMEDAHIAQCNIGQDVSIFGVFDGHGGDEVSKFVAQHFVEELQQNINFKANIMDLALIQTFEKMDELLDTEKGKKETSQLKFRGSAKLQSLPVDLDGHIIQQSRAGCTAIVALIYQKTLYVANAGDSKCIVSSNQIVEMSQDHKPYLESEYNRVIKAGAKISEDGRINDNINFTRAIGDLEFKNNLKLAKNEQVVISTPEVKQKNLDQNDEFILLGCDGLWELHSQTEIVNYISKKIRNKIPNKEIMEKLLDKCIAPDTLGEKKGCDNMSAILIIFNK